MDFLLSFRLFKDFVPLKTKKYVESENLFLDRDAFTGFLFLSVDNAVWKFFQVYGLTFRFIITTYTITFYESENGFHVHDYLNIVLDLFFFIDFISALIYRITWPNQKLPPEQLSSHVSRLVWRNELYRPRKIWMLILDLISLVPFELIRTFTKFRSVAHMIAHCTPILRAYRIFVFHVESKKNIFLRGTAITELILKFAVLWLLTNHIFTCIFRWCTMYDGNDIVKEMKKSISFDNSSINVYIVLFYVNQFAFGNIGFGDIPPTTDGERLLTTVITIVGFSLLNGYFISDLSNALAEKMRRVAFLRLRISLMKSELSNRRVPAEVITKLEKFYHSLWVSRNGVGSNPTIRLSLPDSLWSRIYCDIFTPALNASLLFRSVDEFAKRAIARAMEVNLYMAGDVILRRSEVNSKMFYIRKGTVEIMSYQDDETQIVSFGAGSTFGQMALLLSIPARSEIHAATFCEIHIIQRRSLFLVLSDYPNAKDVIFNVHKNLLLNVMADKFKRTKNDGGDPENLLTSDLFYKIPREASKIARNDICVVRTCPYIFEPNTTYQILWDVLITLIVLVIAFYYPYCATFERVYPKKVEPFIVISDIILVLNIYLNGSTAFVKENTLFSSLRAIITSELRKISTFVDVISMFPIHYFIKDDSREKPVILCLRCMEIHYFFKKAEASVTLKMISWLRLIKFVLYFFFIGYMMGIIFYLEACYYDPCISDSWYPNNVASLESNSPVWASLYIAILITSGTGYGDITPKNMRDVGCIIASSLFGVLLFLYLIAEYSANLSVLGEPKRNFLDLAERIHAFLVTHKMLPSERIRVRQFLNLQWERNQGYEFTSNSDLFYDTPQHLLYNINQYTKSRGLRNMKLFKDISDDVLSTVLARSYRKVLPPHEVVIYAGEICSTLILIEEGFCEITYAKDASVKKIIGAGKDVCTVELMLGLTSMCNVRTLTHCTILKVEKHHLLGAFKENPIAFKEMEESLEEFEKSPIVQEIKKTRPIRLHLIVRPSVQKSLYRFRYYRKEGGNAELRTPYLKLGLCQWIRFILVPTTVLPYGKLLKVWELSRGLFAFCSAMLFPLLPFFQLQVPALFYIGWVLDATAWIDLYFRIHVGHYNDIKLLVSHPLSTFSHYIKGSFVLDFVFCFPFDRIMFRPLYDSNGLAFVSNGPISFLRFLRVLQIYRIPAAVTNLGVDFLSNPGLYRMLTMMIAFTIIFMNVITSCLMLICINYKANKKGYYKIVIADKYKEHFQKVADRFKISNEPFTLYFVNYYWITETAVSLGYGDIIAENKELMIFVIILIVLSYLYLNFVTIIIASYLTSINLNLTLYQKRMSHLIKYLKAETVDPILRKHIINHFEYVWERQKGMKARFVFQNFSAALKNDVLLYLYEETLRNVGAFFHAEQTVFRIISSYINELNFRVGASIYKTGDIISEIFIIHNGEVTLVGKNEDETVTLGPSMIFGHLDNVPRGIPKLSAVATKNVTILSINTKVLYDVFGKVKAWTAVNRDEEIRKLRDTLIHSNELKAGTNPNKFHAPDQKVSYRYFMFLLSKYALIFYVILSLFSINEVSYNAAFQGYNLAFALVIVPVEVLFVLKIALGFTTGFLDEAGDFVSDYHRIRRKYMRFTGFYLDFFTVIPFEVFAFAFHKEDQLYAASLFRLTKFLRVRNIQYFFNMKVDTLSVNMVLHKITTVVVWTLTLLHQCTCLWYFASCHRSRCHNSRTWKHIMDGDFHNFYLNSLYFAVVALTTTGFGDVTPLTMLECFCVDVLIFVGFFYTAIFIGQIISTLQKSVLAKKNYEYEGAAMKMFLSVNDVSNDTQSTVLRYMGNIWANEMGQQIPKLLRDAPPYLKNEIKQSTYGHHINDNSVFGTCNEFFKKCVINELERINFFPGDIIVNEGEQPFAIKYDNFQCRRWQFSKHYRAITCKILLHRHIAEGFLTALSPGRKKMPYFKKQKGDFSPNQSSPGSKNLGTGKPTDVLLIYLDQVNRTMYFVHSGIVESSNLGEDLPIKIYGKNTFFGLRQGVWKKEPYAMTFTARTQCSILSLKLKKWDFLVEFYPEDVQHILKESEDDKWI